VTIAAKNFRHYSKFHIIKKVGFPTLANKLHFSLQCTLIVYWLLHLKIYFIHISYVNRRKYEGLIILYKRNIAVNRFINRIINCILIVKSASGYTVNLGAILDTYLKIKCFLNELINIYKLLVQPHELTKKYRFQFQYPLILISVSFFPLQYVPYIKKDIFLMFHQF